MKRPFRGIILLIISGFYMIIGSCLDITCTDDITAFIKTGFYSYDSQSVAAPDSISLYGQGKTVKIYDGEQVTPPALIPLNDTADISVLIITINGITDTLRFHYWSYPHLVSKECGYSMFHTVDTILHTKNNIDSVSIINENITNQNVENIRIYY